MKKATNYFHLFAALLSAFLLGRYVYGTINNTLEVTPLQWIMTPSVMILFLVQFITKRKFKDE